MKKLLALALSLAMALSLAACGSSAGSSASGSKSAAASSGASSSAAEPVELTVFAAASMGKYFPDIPGKKNDNFILNRCEVDLFPCK